MKKGKLIRYASILLFILFCFQSAPLYSASMEDYCSMPPYVTTGITPNLLLMVDNSASMFDLTYIDKGNRPTREPFYCYDQTYNYGTKYAGYFIPWFRYYEYDIANNYFYEVSAPTWTSCNKYINGTLCIDGTNLDNDSTPKTVTRFVAEGNYLNWLTTSKFDAEKWILTGGKYDTATNDLLQETRGCVGRRFIKEPITTQSFQNYPCADPSTCINPNTGLGLTFAVKGPDHPYSQTLLSPGGQTNLEIYAGNYIEANCQQAVTDINNGENKNTITNDIELCLDYDAHGQYCSLDITISCDDDTDCAGTPGTCSIVNDGVCTPASNGVCSVTTEGVCTANNGTCPSGKKCIGGSNAGLACNNIGDCPGGSACSRACSGGGKAGAACNNDNDCYYNSCTAGLIGSLCNVNPSIPDNDECDIKTCTAGLIGSSCAVNPDCNTKACTAGNIGPPPPSCLINTDCNSGSGTCTAGNVGPPPPSCLIDTDCSIGYKGVCQRPVTQQIKSTYGQSVHECIQYWDTGSLVGNNWYSMMTNPSGCNQMYKELFTCNGGSRAAKFFVVPAGFPGGPG